ncbi:MAG TPA: neutral zinc metallopeptidase, partial [Noviherbaspirillum sp.]|nr:neutral zinc metallopeptidase [Noviherbaspirillum sp.]
MRWEGNRESENVEDRRGDGGGGFSIGGGSLSIGTVVIAVVASLLFGVNPLSILSMLSGGQGQVAQVQPAHQAPANDRMTKFVKTVLADTEDT